MILGRCERAVIYGTDSIYVQMERWLLNHPDKTADMKEMRGFFSDLSNGAFLSAISVLSTRGMIRVEGNLVTLTVSDVVSQRGELSDAVWRAVRILKVFTAKEIQKLLPSLERRTVLDILDGLVKAGAVVRDGRTDRCEIIFRLVSDSKVRPVTKAEKKKGKVDVIWEIVKGFKNGIWTSNDIKADERWKDSGASSKYLDELLRQWRGESVIEEVDADTRSRREARKYHTLSHDERQTVLTHYGRKTDGKKRNHRQDPRDEVKD